MSRLTTPLPFPIRPRILAGLAVVALASCEASPPPRQWILVQCPPGVPASATVPGAATITPAPAGAPAPQLGTSQGLSGTITWNSPPPATAGAPLGGPTQSSPPPANQPPPPQAQAQAAQPPANPTPQGYPTIVARADGNCYEEVNTAYAAYPPYPYPNPYYPPPYPYTYYGAPPFGVYGYWWFGPDHRWHHY